MLPGVEGGQVGQVGAGSGAGRLTAVKRAAGDGEEAFFRHDWMLVVAAARVPPRLPPNSSRSVTG